MLTTLPRNPRKTRGDTAARWGPASSPGKWRTDPPRPSPAERTTRIIAPPTQCTNKLRTNQTKRVHACRFDFPESIPSSETELGYSIDENVWLLGLKSTRDDWKNGPRVAIDPTRIVGCNLQRGGYGLGPYHGAVSPSKWTRPEDVYKSMTRPRPDSYPKRGNYATFGYWYPAHEASTKKEHRPPIACTFGELSEAYCQIRTARMVSSQSTFTGRPTVVI